MITSSSPQPPPIDAPSRPLAFVALSHICAISPPVTSQLPASNQPLCHRPPVCSTSPAGLRFCARASCQFNVGCGQASRPRVAAYSPLSLVDRPPHHRPRALSGWPSAPPSAPAHAALLTAGTSHSNAALCDHCPPTHWHWPRPSSPALLRIRDRLDVKCSSFGKIPDHPPAAHSCSRVYALPPQLPRPVI